MALLSGDSSGFGRCTRTQSACGNLISYLRLGLNILGRKLFYIHLERAVCMAKGKYSDHMIRLGCIRPQKGMAYGFPPKHRPENYHIPPY